MRVIAGSRKGHQLAAPPGREVRPTSDRVRTVLFDTLGESVVAARVLDLFAGAGTLGVEALSRGAHSADFVENHRAHARLIQENLRRTHLEHHGRVILEDAFVFLSQAGRHEAPYQIILADPPYHFSEISKLFELLEAATVLAENGTFVWEASVRSTSLRSGNVPAFVREKIVGETVLRFYRKQ